METQFRNINAVNHDGTTSRLDNSEQCQRERRFASTRATNDSYFFAPLYREIYTFEH